ncbi:hypothetical protein AG1IA_05707 [Rhizoctonia solani AG-1 IA]|uniref:Uncharacterized protein n=1 Tax=Thanatephorus cucumeris (strain AG1-IA) TaxID=983506 RepID=L8WQ65_THACA|nr:hypothetical protein AG1IA_05707 [Rhizoctonia solani AG-1 IA]
MSTSAGSKPITQASGLGSTHPSKRTMWESYQSNTSQASQTYNRWVDWCSWTRRAVCIRQTRGGNPCQGPPIEGRTSGRISNGLSQRTVANVRAGVPKNNSIGSTKNSIFVLYQVSWCVLRASVFDQVIGAVQ